VPPLSLPLPPLPLLPLPHAVGARAAHTHACSACSISWCLAWPHGTCCTPCCAQPCAATRTAAAAASAARRPAAAVPGLRPCSSRGTSSAPNASELTRAAPKASCLCSARRGARAQARAAAAPAPAAGHFHAAQQQHPAAPLVGRRRATSRAPPYLSRIPSSPLSPPASLCAPLHPQLALSAAAPRNARQRLLASLSRSGCALARSVRLGSRPLPAPSRPQPCAAHSRRHSQSIHLASR
jgi:hypothetical protein